MPHCPQHDKKHTVFLSEVMTRPNQKHDEWVRCVALAHVRHDAALSRSNLPEHLRWGQIMELLLDADNKGL